MPTTCHFPHGSNECNIIVSTPEGPENSVYARMHPTVNPRVEEANPVSLELRVQFSTTCRFCNKIMAQAVPLQCCTRKGPCEPCAVTPTFPYGTVRTRGVYDHRC